MTPNRNGFDAGIIQLLAGGCIVDGVLHPVAQAILYGFGLILAAFVLALVYGWLAKSEEAPSSEEGRK